MRILAKPKRGASNRRFSIIYEVIENDDGNKFIIDEFSVRRFLFTRYEIFHIHWPDRVFASPAPIIPLKIVLLWVGLYFMRFRQTQIVWTVHNPHIKFSHKLGHLIEGVFYKILLNKVNYFVFPSSEAERSLKRKGAQYKIHLQESSCFSIPLGLQTELVAEGERQPPELSVKGEKYFLIIGRVNPEKKIPETIEKLIPVVERLGCKLVVAGKCDNILHRDSLLSNCFTTGPVVK